jgi:hypothetical protein
MPDTVTLEWQQDPQLQRIADETTQLPLESRDWLRSQLSRPARAVGDDQAFNRATTNRKCSCRPTPRTASTPTTVGVPRASRRILV